MKPARSFSFDLKQNIMKKILIAGCAFLTASISQGQMKEGKVTYERVSQMQLHINNGDGDNVIPNTRTDKFELTFGNNQSIWKQGEREMEDDGGGGGGARIMMFTGGSDDMLFNDFTTGKKTEQREFFDKKFIIDDSIRPLKWKMTGETKMILNHNCMKATASQVNARMQMTMENGQMQRKMIQDTSLVIAWFASDIPVSAGPAEFQGQLPGLILEMDVANGRQTYKATEISAKADLASIKAPSGKKHYTREEFRTEVDKMMQEMQRNNGGNGNMQFRVRD